MRCQRTDIRRDASEDDLALVLSGNSGPEVRVVPCIYLSISLDQRSVGEHVQDLFGQRAIGSRLSAGGQDDGYAEYLCDGGMRDDVVTEHRRVIIPDLDET